MANKRFVVKLNSEERKYLEAKISKGRTSAKIILAVASPMPLVPPVTSAVFPSGLPMEVLFGLNLRLDIGAYAPI